MPLDGLRQYGALQRPDLPVPVLRHGPRGTSSTPQRYERRTDPIGPARIAMGRAMHRIQGLTARRPRLGAAAHRASNSGDGRSGLPEFEIMDVGGRTRSGYRMAVCEAPQSSRASGGRGSSRRAREMNMTRGRLISACRLPSRAPAMIARVS